MYFAEKSCCAGFILAEDNDLTRCNFHELSLSLMFDIEQSIQRLSNFGLCFLYCCITIARSVNPDLQLGAERLLSLGRFYAKK